MSEPLPRSAVPRLGVLVPATLVLFLVAEFALRGIPLTRLAFRAWEVVWEEPAAGAPFTPNFRYVNDEAHGDLASLANRPSFREVRRETFATDARGFRNAPDLLEHGPPDVVVFGDSCAVGAGVSDHETLAAQLAGITGLRVYNAAGTGLQYVDVQGVLTRLGFSRGAVVIETVERRGTDRRRGVLWKLRPIRFPPIDQMLRKSRIRILSAAARKGLQNDIFLPNVHAARAPEMRLRDGTSMLCLAEEYDSDSPGAEEERTARQIAAIAASVRSADVRVIALVVPSKLNVHRPLLAEGAVPAERTSPRLRDLESRLRALDVEVVSILEPLQQAAEAALARGERIFLRDDTHWNAAGIRVAAEQLGAAITGPR